MMAFTEVRTRCRFRSRLDAVDFVDYSTCALTYLGSSGSGYPSQGCDTGHILSKKSARNRNRALQKVQVTSKTSSSKYGKPSPLLRHRNKMAADWNSRIKKYVRHSGTEPPTWANGVVQLRHVTDPSVFCGL